MKMFPAIPVLLHQLFLLVPKKQAQALQMPNSVQIKIFASFVVSPGEGVQIFSSF